MADWKDCKPLKTTDPLLALCSHLANGAKHFEKLHKEHKSVASANFEGVYEPGVFEEGVFEESLHIKLEPDTANVLGTSNIDAVSLAEKVLEFWENHQ